MFSSAMFFATALSRSVKVDIALLRLAMPIAQDFTRCLLRVRSILFRTSVSRVSCALLLSFLHALPRSTVIASLIIGTFLD